MQNHSGLEAREAGMQRGPVQGKTEVGFVTYIGFYATFAAGAGQPAFEARVRWVARLRNAGLSA